MNLGGEPKKVAILAVLVVVGGYVFYTNVFSSPDRPSSNPRPKTTATLPAIPEAPPVASSRRSSGRRSDGNDFRPRFRSTRPEERPDPSAIDPTLRLDLLGKVQSVETATGARNLFQFTTAAAVAAANPLKPPEPAKIIPRVLAQGPVAPPTPVVPSKPPPPPINLKYYGYSTSQQGSRKRAFFMDGDEILIGSEGDLVKRRYRVVRIGVNSVVVEDTQFSNTQTLALPEEAAG